MKQFLFCILIGFIVSSLGAVINYFYFRSRGWLLIALQSFGGEITVQYGPGFRLVHIYAMNPESRDSISLRFDLLSILLCALLLGILVYGLYRLVLLIKK